MPASNSDPNDVRPTLPGKNSDANKGKEERFPLDGLQVFLQRLFNIARDVAEKTEGQMHLLGRKAAHAAHFRIQIHEQLGNGWRKLDADEKPFRAHRRLANSLSASPPGARTKERLIGVILDVGANRNGVNGPVVRRPSQTKRQESSNKTEECGHQERRPAIFGDGLFQIQR